MSPDLNCPRMSDSCQRNSTPNPTLESESPALGASPLPPFSPVKLLSDQRSSAFVCGSIAGHGGLTTHNRQLATNCKTPAQTTPYLLDARRGGVRRTVGRLATMVRRSTLKEP